MTIIIAIRYISRRSNKGTCFSYHTIMTDTADKDEYHDKPSTRKQWHEESKRPVITHRMTKQDIEDHRRNLLAMYKCDDDAITVSFMKITDKADDDYDDCLILIYKLKCVRHSKQENRNIYSIKIPIPDSLKQQAAKIRAEELARSQQIRALPAPEQPETAVPVVTPTATPITIPTSTPTTTTRPALRKPAVKRVAKK